MAITLPDDVQKALEAEVAAGSARSIEELAASALRQSLKELAEFRGSLDSAEAQGEANGWLSLDDVKARLAQRLAVYRK